MPAAPSPARETAQPRRAKKRPMTSTTWTSSSMRRIELMGAVAAGPRLPVRRRGVREPVWAGERVRGDHRRPTPRSARESSRRNGLRPSGGRCVLLGQRRSLLAMGDHGLAEAEAEITKLRGFLRGELGVAFCQVLERVIHPFALLFLGGLEHATAVDVTEELVAGSIEEGRLGCVTTQKNPPWNRLRGRFERGRW